MKYLSQMTPILLVAVLQLSAQKHDSLSFGDSAVLIKRIRSLNYSSPGKEKSSTIVGRVCILVITPKGTIEVSPEHKFQAGDHFRLRVEANRAGYISLFNAADDGNIICIWPRDKGNTIVNKQNAILIPEPPATFTFDTSNASEELYVVLTPDIQDTLAAAQKKTGTLKQIFIRDLRQAYAKPFSYVPKTGDHCLYFTPFSADDNAIAMLKIVLKR